MQTQKRATLVGQTTGGGANPGGTRGINADLTVFIPTGRAINPITNTSWEGTGVIPEVATKPEETMDKTYELAKVAAEEFRSRNNEKYKRLLLGLYKNLDNYTSNSSDESILESFKSCLEAGVIEEWNINVMGYEYLMEKQKPKAAVAIFKANTILHPNSANVFDSYAEGLASIGDLKNAVVSYQKAVEVATKNEDPQLKLFKENLEKMKVRLADEKKP